MSETRSWRSWRFVRWSLLLLALLGLPISAGAYSEREVVQDEVAALLTARDYTALDALVVRYEQGERTASGMWKLTSFDRGIAATMGHTATDDPAWEAVDRSLKEWIAHSPQSAAARLAFARALLTRAWAYRGTGFADTVEQEDLAAFKQLVEQARVYLLEHEPVAGLNPLWYQMMLEVGKSQDWPQQQYLEMSDAGLDRFPGYYQLYFQVAGNFLPQWGGSLSAIEDFARAAVKRTEATEGATLYARIYWLVYQTALGKTIFTQSKVDWPLMRRGIEDILDKYPDQWNINNFAKFACLARDSELTIRLTSKITTPSAPAVWRDQQELETCRHAAQRGWSVTMALRANYYWVIGSFGVLLLLGLFLHRRTSPAR